MWKRTTNLLARDPATVGTILVHPRQLWACEVVEDLIARLRELSSSEDHYDFQRLLFSHLIEVEREQAHATRMVKRSRAGKSVPPAPHHNWETEQAALDRVVRQLRSVGDGLAWRLHGFDRRIILALSGRASLTPSGRRASKPAVPYPSPVNRSPVLLRFFTLSRAAVE